MAKKVKCPYCGRRIALTKLGKLYSHYPYKGASVRCARSGGRPS
jgi:hypothetical protein